MDKENIKLGHSPDADDAFMFYAISKNKIDTKNYNFTHIIKDIETLNQKALKEELEITAVSLHAYTLLHKNYAILSSGASMGKNYGPIVISKKQLNKKDLQSCKIAIPGNLTTANLSLKLYLKANFKSQIKPFNKIIEAVLKEEVEAGLIIHEGQLLYRNYGLKKIVDLGQWWYEKHQLPLPLGINVIHRKLGEKKILELSSILKESIVYSMDNEDMALDYAMKYAGEMDKEIALQFVRMYVNDYTVEISDQGKRAVNTLLEEAYFHNIIRDKIDIHFY